MRNGTADIEYVAGSRRIRRRFIGAALTLALAWPSAAPAQEVADAVLRLRGFGLNVTGVGQGRTAGPESLRYDARAGTLELDPYVPEPVRIDELRVVGPAGDDLDRPGLN